jgi:hypothetical protein
MSMVKGMLSDMLQVTTYLSVESSDRSASTGACKVRSKVSLVIMLSSGRSSLSDVLILRCVRFVKLPRLPCRHDLQL